MAPEPCSAKGLAGVQPHTWTQRSKLHAAQNAEPACRHDHPQQRHLRAIQHGHSGHPGVTRLARQEEAAQQQSAPLQGHAPQHLVPSQPWSASTPAPTESAPNHSAGHSVSPKPAPSRDTQQLGGRLHELRHSRPHSCPCPCSTAPTAILTTPPRLIPHQLHWPPIHPAAPHQLLLCPPPCPTCRPLTRGRLGSSPLPPCSVPPVEASTRGPGHAC
ncbi:hypothetical protein HaLaN_10319 [Haematococcus lacustris]|uniref:Uncharacterized protein n=1 Tax=Haematococcus lacustris TaxID=44745 RepID=A0A699YXA8_HAELA|nr:hypothetical protein HaLaN_10319 [Haematococcus lacustris]